MFLREIAELFILRSHELLATLAQSLAAGDVAGVQAAAHALKGSAAELSATEVVQIARRLEKTARSEDLSALVIEGHSLQQFTLRLNTALETWLKQMGRT